MKQTQETAFHLVRSRRRTIALEIGRDLSVTVRAPFRMSMRAIEAFVQEQAPWIEKHREIMRERVEAQKEQQVEKLTEDQVRALAKQACEILPGRVERYAQTIGVTYGRITIRTQKTRWGSCSGKGNLNFNCLLMLMPDEIIDYVVVHELCHRLEMNHSKRFWALVEEALPDYRVRRKWLKEHGSETLRRWWE